MNPKVTFRAADLLLDPPDPLHIGLDPGTVDKMRQRQAALPLSASEKEVADLTSAECLAIIYASGARVEVAVIDRDGILRLDLRAENVGIVKVDGKFVVGQRIGGVV